MCMQEYQKIRGQHEQISHFNRDMDYNIVCLLPCWETAPTLVYQGWLWYSTHFFHIRFVNCVSGFHLDVRSSSGFPEVLDPQEVLVYTNLKIRKSPVIPENSLSSCPIADCILYDMLTFLLYFASFWLKKYFCGALWSIYSNSSGLHNWHCASEAI